MLRKFGVPSHKSLQEIQKKFFHSENLYCAAIDGAALWDPGTIDDIVREMPSDLIPQSDLYLLITECFANATLHSRAEILGFHVRHRKGLLMVCFSQLPPMPQEVGKALHVARQGKMPGYDEASTGGLGFPILVRLARRVTFGADGRTLSFWFEVLDF